MYPIATTVSQRFKEFLTVYQVSSTGTYLPERDAVYLRISLFGRVGRTCAVRPDFPLRFYESFHFEKVS